MKKFLFPLILLLWCVGSACGLLEYCWPISSSPVAEVRPQQTVIVECLDPTLEPFANGWKTEVARRFPDAVVILVHGGNFVEGQWIVEGDYASGMHVQPVEDVILKYEKLFPHRPIVLTACNPGHVILHNFPGCLVCERFSVVPAGPSH